jgi:hypothetical protein
VSGVPEHFVSRVALSIQTGQSVDEHFQREPMLDAKIVRCTVGAIYDVMTFATTRRPSDGGMIDSQSVKTRKAAGRCRQRV